MLDSREVQIFKHIKYCAIDSCNEACPPFWSNRNTE